MFGNLPPDVETDLMHKNITPNFHSYGVTVEVLWLLFYLFVIHNILIIMG